MATNEKLMLEAVAVIADLRAQVASLETDLGKARADVAKARSTATDNTVKGAIAQALDPVAKQISSAQVRKSRRKTSADLSDHFISDKRAVQKAERSAEMQKVAEESTRRALEALRKV